MYFLSCSAPYERFSFLFTYNSLMNINIFKIFNKSNSNGYLFSILLHILSNAFSYIILKPIHLCTNSKEVELVIMNSIQIRKKYYGTLAVIHMV